MAETASIQAKIATATVGTAAMSTKIITSIDLTIIVIREAKEVTIMMTGKEEVAIVLAIKVKHIMWRKHVTALALAPRVAVIVTAALQAAAVFQTDFAFALALAQMKASKVMTITM
eukprot:7975664-Ditylum_brightwellii.AAC.2